MDTESKIFQAPDTNGVIKSSWQHLLLATLAIVVVNNSIYLLCKSIDSIPFLVNAIYLIGAAGCQALLTGSAFYRYEQAKIVLTTDRRKASLFGVVFKENFRFQKTYDALGGTPGLIKAIGMLSIGLTLIAYGDFTGLRFSTGLLGLLIVFCLLADWLWMPILLSGAFMVIAAHQSFGAQDIKTFSVIALLGLECLCFAWFIGNRMESIRFNSVRAGEKQNRTQITLLALTFLVIASVIFMVLPKKIDIKINNNKLGQAINRQIDKVTKQRPESWSGNNTGKLPQSKVQEHQKEQTSWQQSASQQTPQQSDGSISDSPEQENSASEQDQNTDQNNSGGTKSGKGHTSDSTSKTSGIEMSTDDPDATQASQSSENSDPNEGDEREGDDSSQKYSSDKKNMESSLKKTSGKPSKDHSKNNTGKGVETGAGKGDKKDPSSPPSKNKNDISDADQSSTTSAQSKYSNKNSGKKLTEESKKPTKPKPPKKALPKLNKKTIVIVLLVLMLIALIVVLIKAMRNKKGKSLIEKPEPDLPTQAEISAAMRKFRQDYQRLMSTPETSDADRRARMIALYNLLLEHYESCGLAKPEYFTPDDFDRFEFIYRAPGKKALAFVTSSFNRAYYGLKIPAQQEYQNYCNCIAELGMMLAKLAPRTP